MIYNINDKFEESFVIFKNTHQNFIQLSEDRNPLHTNNEFAISKGFKGIVMHGNILNAFISYFIGECLPTKDVIIHSQEIQFKNELKTAQRQKNLQDQNIILTEKIYKNAIMKQKAGKISNTEVTQKLNQLIMTQAEYTATLINVFKSKIKLDKLYNKLYIK